MRVFFGCFSIIPVITWILLYRKQRELMDPVNIYTLIYMINTMLPIILFSLDSGNAAIGNRYLRCAVENDSLFIKYVLLQVFAYYLVVGGMHINIPIKLHMKDRVSYYLAVCQDDGNKKYVIWGCLFWIVGFFAFFMIMRQVGGIYYFFTNLQHRTTLMRNIDFWSWLLTLMNYACLFFVYALKGTSKKPRIPLIVILCISGIMVGLGGRKALLMLLLEAIIVYHYSVKRFALKDLFKIKYIFALVDVYKRQM